MSPLSFALKRIEMTMSTKGNHKSQQTPPQFVFEDWGHLPYADAYARQLALLDGRIRGERGDTIAFVEHPHVFTYGRSSLERDWKPEITVLGEPVSQVAIERGGDVTYHGPGQLVMYPIVDVRALTGDLHRFLRWIQDTIITTIAHWDITGRHHPEHTGVWVGDRKIASIGVAVRKWISFHGVALNVSTDLRFFGAIKPCGLPSEVMTSMAEVTATPIRLDDVKERLQDVLSEKKNR
ncbi:MAG: lipoyl(octanoyl) transferase LipB [candidate division Zixibacteria bacterium]|nr:lipoyl(octanoyl) transferase LipB [candidate division Zixibacteria bacterium]